MRLAAWRSMSSPTWVARGYDTPPAHHEPSARWRVIRRMTAGMSPDSASISKTTSEAGGHGATTSVARNWPRNWSIKDNSVATALAETQMTEMQYRNR